MLKESKAQFVFSIGNFGHPIQRALRLDSTSHVSAFYPENMNKRSQDLEPAFHDAGQFYWGTQQGWLNQQSIFGGDAIGYPLPRHRLVDIDNEEDWVLAETLYRATRMEG
jgi:pseudaminic acid cytidylyltransferase